MTEARVARRFEVNGVVQGVGFRPFVYQLALTHHLTGQVANTDSGVSIHVEGTAARLAAFAEELPAKIPPLAHVTHIASHAEPLRHLKHFTISASRDRGPMTTLISPDMATCDACRDELFDPTDRRYRYPFINCTNCGPRFTIIAETPYDRPKTSMRHFNMCPACQAEYDDPLDRRFHAQPNGCARCGPKVALWDNRGDPFAVGDDPIVRTAALLKNGAIVAIKGLGGFHLAVDARSSDAVQRLRRRKHRDAKPLALMSPDIAAIETYAHVGAEQEAGLTSAQRPIVLLKKRDPNPICPEVCPNNRYFGVMLPYTPIHHLLLDEGFLALVMTSGNFSEEPIAVDNAEAVERLRSIADYFLVHNREIYLRCDDSLVNPIAGKTRFMRRSRGYVPLPVFLKQGQDSVLACGAELKNTVCITKGNQAFLSQHIGDLENESAYAYFQQAVAHLQRILAIEPEIVAHDLHPDYLSTRYAQERPCSHRVAVQHHHAHIVSCMAEHHLEGEVIGLAFDGTGYGPDGAVWGGEVLLAGIAGFTRAAHLAYLPMPGSAAAIRDPWRMALSHLQAAYGDAFRELDLDLLDAIEDEKVDVIATILKRGLNSPPTSSMGRLFDAVAALAGVRQTVAFEGQAAMELETIAAPLPETGYEYRWERTDPVVIDTCSIIRGVVEDRLQGRSAATISARFHRTLIDLFGALCGQIQKATGLRRVVLSGGVFQNALLLEGMILDLTRRGFQVFAHEKVPSNDGGIALGQAVAAAGDLGLGASMHACRTP